MESITTDRILIRKFQEADWKDLYEYLSDETVVIYEPYEVYTQEQAKEEAKYRSENDCFYAVCIKETGKLIGNLYFAKGDFDTWELGYVFNQNYWGHGYATESAKALLDTAFSNFGARRVIAGCDQLNHHSWKLLERLGMRREGAQLQNIYFKKDQEGNPIWVDSYRYAVLKSEWMK